ncbi:HemK2/MTQ2 family protein methyltransferase [Nocardia sp. NPDC019395]|uniref:HemK2/MTQ2 family protein methyltransferase n=1 Tax=Nocardia sp. NPDC019395 TaxID=3154686 RepID=UPI00340CBDE6
MSAMLVRAPGVYRPQPDTWLLARAMTEAALPPGTRVLDACTGTGALAIHAARTGAAAVTAVDLSRTAVASAWLNSRLRGVRLELLCGDVTRVVAGRTFDVIVANPPYVPSDDPAASRRSARAWDAGRYGRSVLDPLCVMMPRLLDIGGTALIVHSALSGPTTSLGQLRDGGLKATVVARTMIPFGPVLARRSGWLCDRGLIRPGQQHEELVVIRADRTR